METSKGSEDSVFEHLFLDYRNISSLIRVLLVWNLSYTLRTFTWREPFTWRDLCLRFLKETMQEYNDNGNFAIS